MEGTVIRIITCLLGVVVGVVVDRLCLPEEKASHEVPLLIACFPMRFKMIAIALASFNL